MAISCTAEMEHKSQKINVVVAAAEKYLGVRDMNSKELQGVLSGRFPSSQVVGLGYDQIGLKYWNSP